tara:strand:- start:36 stop:209 length:174 start_codon:yes stop_codon:yes gene_type:complete
MNLEEKILFDKAMKEEVKKQMPLVPYYDQCKCECHKPGVSIMHMMACCKSRPKEINE